jgi:hypothetical protein
LGFSGFDDGDVDGALDGAAPEEPEESDPLLEKFATSWPMRFSSTIADCVKPISSWFLR